MTTKISLIKLPKEPSSGIISYHEVTYNNYILNDDYLNGNIKYVYSKYTGNLIIKHNNSGNENITTIHVEKDTWYSISFSQF